MSGTWKEVMGPEAAPSTVTLMARRGEATLVVGRGVLPAVPWYRGGVEVSVLEGRGASAGKLRVQRGTGHRLRADASTGPLDRLPPVVLRLGPLEGLAPDAEYAAEPVAYTISHGLLEVALPRWAAPPVPVTAPATSYSPAYFRDLSGGRAA